MVLKEVLRSLEIVRTKRTEERGKGDEKQKNKMSSRESQRDELCVLFSN